MLYSMTIGEPGSFTNPWTLINNGEKDKWLEKADIRQKIRIDASVPITDDLVQYYKREKNPVATQCFKLPKNTVLLNYSKDMNTVLVPTKKQVKQHIIYITITNRYAIYLYETDHEIRASYHEENMYQGCCLVVPEDVELGVNVMSILVKDTITGKYLRFNIQFNDKGACFVKDHKIDDDTMSIIKSKEKKYPNHRIPFRLAIREFCTQIYISKESDAKLIEEKIYGNRKKSGIISVPNVLADGKQTEKRINDLVECLRPCIEQYKIKAVTLVNMHLPLEVIRKLNILYVFEYNTQTNELICKKST